MKPRWFTRGLAVAVLTWGAVRLPAETATLSLAEARAQALKMHQHHGG